MEETGDGLVGELIDVADLDLEVVLAVDPGPLAGCIRRLIAQSGRGESAVAGFNSVIGDLESGPHGEEPTHVA